MYNLVASEKLHLSSQSIVSSRKRQFVVNKVDVLCLHVPHLLGPGNIVWVATVAFGGVGVEVVVVVVVFLPRSIL